MPAVSSLSLTARPLHDGEHLQRRDQAVAGGGAIEAQDVARGLAAEDAAVAP